MGLGWTPKVGVPTQSVHARFPLLGDLITWRESLALGSLIPLAHKGFIVSSAVVALASLPETVEIPLEQ